MTAHRCDEHCSHRLTPDSLSALGFPVLKTDRCVGAVRVVREGKAFEAARYDAWLAGAVRLCTRTGH